MRHYLELRSNVAMNLPRVNAILYLDIQGVGEWEKQNLNI